jgi:hypothetical protein
MSKSKYRREDYRVSLQEFKDFLEKTVTALNHNIVSATNIDPETHILQPYTIPDLVKIVLSRVKVNENHLYVSDFIVPARVKQK